MCVAGDVLRLSIARRHTPASYDGFFLRFSCARSGSLAPMRSVSSHRSPSSADPPHAATECRRRLVRSRGSKRN
jgi:hypothetical protein